MMDEILDVFQARLLEENEKQNLISRKTAAVEAPKHIADSLSLLQFVDLKGEKLVDIGSGAGFPGLILGIVSRETKVTLIESDLKKSKFLTDTAEYLHAGNVRVVRERAEIVGQNPEFREKFTVCTSRAVASIRIMLEYALPLLKVGGSVYLWKGPKYPEELAEAQNALQLLGGEVGEIYSYHLPETEARYLVQIKKKHATAKKYPRNNGVPAKRPL